LGGELLLGAVPHKKLKCVSRGSYILSQKQGFDSKFGVNTQ
jgi:hypothetical protein